MKKYGILALVICFLFPPLRAEEKKYTSESFARLNFLNGSVFLQRGADLGYEEGVLNMPISEGDRLGTTEGRAEVYLPKGTFIRLDINTKIDFVNLPKKGDDLTRLRVWTGNIYLSTYRLAKEKGIEIHSPDVSIYILEEGLYRIDVSENEKTEIYVYDGVIEAAGEEGSVLLKGQQSFEVTDGRFASKPRHFYAVAEDSFDRWSESRESRVRREIQSLHLPEELADFENELSENGDWIYLKPYGWVWVPRGVEAEWRPYYHGYWDWLPYCGWTWVPYEPWGWATFHYGWWNWGASIGWHWIPGTFWGPAWVGWYWGPTYCAWAPLSFWYYPWASWNAYYWGLHWTGGYWGWSWGPQYPHYFRGLTVIHKDQLKAKNISQVALKPGAAKDLGKITLNTQSPKIRPAGAGVSAESLGGNKIFLKKDRSQLISNPERTGKARTSAATERSISTKTARTMGIPRGDLPSAAKGEASQSKIKRNSFGYPSSPEISIKKLSGDRSFSRSSSFRSRLYQYLQGGRSSSASRGSISRGKVSPSWSKGGHVSRPAAPPSSSSRSGGVRKKN